jgi:hypothetical protein
MSEHARAWLADRAESVPSALQAEMASALQEVSEERRMPAVLAEAARICLLRALQHGDERAAALPLLAADALVTYACDAASAEGDDALQELASSLDPERLAHYLPPSSAP